MKVLQINCVYQKGSTGKITYDLHRSLQACGVESIVCYGRGEAVSDKKVYKICPEWYSKINNALSRVTGIMYGGCFLSTNRLIKIIKNEKPDIVHLQCINGYFVNIYRILDWLKKSKIKTVLTLHAEFMYTGGCGHAFDCNQWREKNGCGHSIHCPRWRAETRSLVFDRTHVMWELMRDSFVGFDNLVVCSVSPWLKERAMRSPILADKHHEVVYNGLDTEIFHLYDASKIRFELGTEGKRVIFHATPFFSTEPNHIKGGYYICELASLMPNTHFIVAGPYDKRIQVPDNVHLLGAISDQSLLAKLYSMADVTVLASRRETFSMVCAESLCCGSTVVGFNAGAPETISLPEYSTFVLYGDIKKLKTAVINMFEQKHDKAKISAEAKRKYSCETMVKNYLEVYRSMF